MTSTDFDMLKCYELDVLNNTICLEHPEDMLKPWKVHPLFFEIIAVHAVVFVFGVLGNGTVIFILAGDRKSRTATNFFLISLAVGDLLMLCVYGPLETYTHFVINWDENGIICKAAKFAEIVSATSSVLNLLAVTIERFVVIIFPMKSQIFCTSSNIVKAVLGVWILSLILAFPVVLSTNTYNVTFTNGVTSLNLTYCTRSDDSLTFEVYQFLIIFFLPSLTMTVCYSLVIRELWVSTKKMNLLTNRKGTVNRKLITSNDNASHKSNKITARNEVNHARRQVIKMLILVVFIFYFCWGPRVSMDIFQKFNYLQYSKSIYNIRMVFNIMTFFHGCVNPIVYSFMSKNFRSRLFRYLGKWGCKKKTNWSKKFQLTERVKASSRFKSYANKKDDSAKMYQSFVSYDTKSTEVDTCFINLHCNSVTEQPLS